MNNKLLLELQKSYYSLKDNNGNWRESPIGIVKNAKTSIDNIKVLRNIISILMASDNLSDDAKIFICNYSISIKNVNEIINDFRNEASERMNKPLRKVSYNATVSKLASDEKTLVSCIGPDFIKRVMYDQVESKREITDKLDRLLKLYGENNNQRENLTIYISDKYINCNSYKGDERFFDILRDIECYLKQRKEIVENAINSDREFIEYFNYLLSSKGVLDDTVQVDRERLLKFLNNQDYITGYTEEKEIVEEEAIEIKEDAIEIEPKTIEEKVEPVVVEEINTNEIVGESVVEEIETIEEEEETIEIKKETTVEEPESVELKENITIELDDFTWEEEPTPTKEEETIEEEKPTSKETNSYIEEIKRKFSIDNIDEDDILI